MDESGRARSVATEKASLVATSVVRVKRLQATLVVDLLAIMATAINVAIMEW